MSRQIKLRIWDRRLLSFVPDMLLDFGMLTDPNYEATLFSGVYDRDGRELYEGDITLWTCYDEHTGEYFAEVYTVGFENGCFGLSLVGGEDFITFDNLSSGDMLVGNRFESPYLIGLSWLKACRGCRKEQPPGQFALCSYKTGRRSTVCRSCKAQVDAKRYKARKSPLQPSNPSYSNQSTNSQS